MKTSSILRSIVAALVILFAAMQPMRGQTVQLGISADGTNIVVSAQPSAALPSNHMTQVVFTISWLTAYNVTLGTEVSSFGIHKANNELTKTVFTYQKFSMDGFSSAFNWQANTPYEIMRVPVVQSGAGAGSFALREATFDPTGAPFIEIDYNIMTNEANPFFNQFIEVGLPVELSTFTVAMEHLGAALSWKTATETNNAGFEIERAIVAPQTKKEWTKIGYVAGAGTSNSPKEYSFTNKNVQTGTYAYRLKQIDRDGKFSYSKEIEAVVAAPKEFKLTQNYPNPFNPTTTINYAIAEDSRVTVKVYDILGREAATLTEGDLAAGYYNLSFDGRGLASGVYLYCITAKHGQSSFVETKRLMLMK